MQVAADATGADHKATTAAPTAPSTQAEALADMSNQPTGTVARPHLRRVGSSRQGLGAVLHLSKFPALAIGAYG